MTTIFKIFLFFFLLLLLLFFLYFLNFSLVKEGFDNNTQIGGLQNIQSERVHMPLSQYCIKSSYHSAYDGSKVSTQQLLQVISKGVRFIDLEIYCIDEEPYVGYSTDKTMSNITKSTTIPLNDVLKTIFSNCFSSINCSNYNDPLFLHLRIKTKEENRNTIYKIVAKTIDFFFQNNKNKLYQDSNEMPIQVNGNTILNDILQKVIIVIDKSINPDYANYTNCYNITNCVDLTKYVNMESGGNTMSIYSYEDLFNKQTKPPVIMNDFITTNANNLQFAFPDEKNRKNPDQPQLKKYICDYGIQNIAYSFWDTINLEVYENMFIYYKTAYIPFAYAIQYLKQNITI